VKRDVPARRAAEPRSSSAFDEVASLAAYLLLPGSRLDHRRDPVDRRRLDRRIGMFFK